MLPQCVGHRISAQKKEHPRSCDYVKKLEQRREWLLEFGMAQWSGPRNQERKELTLGGLPK